MTLSDLNRWIEPIKHRIANMFARAILNNVDDSTMMQLLQLEVLPGELRDQVERFQEYGFTSVPVKGAEALIARIAGHSDHGVVICVADRRTRPVNLESGEVCVYNKFGTQILIDKNGNTVVTCSGDVTFKGGTTPVAKEGSSTTGHVHTLTGTAGPYSIVGTAITQTDTIATGAGSPNVKVP